MAEIRTLPLSTVGHGFVDKQYLPEGKDEYYLRDAQAVRHPSYRALTAHEVEVLVKNENSSDDWNAVLVTDRFDPRLVSGCKFYGLVRIGDLEPVCLEFHDLKRPVGLYNSTIISCDIGSNVVIDNVRYLSHFIIGNQVILLNIDEMQTTNYAKFGNGIVKEGEPEDVRIWLEICNENGGRRILPFDGMLPGDAYLWSKYRAHPTLLSRFKEMTERQFSPKRGYYGTVGDRCVIKNCRILKDVIIGADAYIKGGNKLKNLTIKSEAGMITQIGEGVELVNGIIGYGSRIFYGVKAVRFQIGMNSSLKYGARLINSVLGDNSTISCCEVLNSLIFPGHEQHHNNSFLCAATVLGQSNMAAGATIGSNHNSRANDGEIVAGRGFWPGLCTSLKHNSRFASYTLLIKGSYPAELDIRLPFSSVSNDEHENCLKIQPAYWFLFNMYALARNSAKYLARDKRKDPVQTIEYDYLAPDTAEEMLAALGLLEEWTGKAWASAHQEEANQSPELYRNLGKRLLREEPETVAALRVLGEDMDASKRPSLILKPCEAYQAYREMLRFYGTKNLTAYLETEGSWDIESLPGLHSVRSREWVNLGGQLVPLKDVNGIIRDVESGKIGGWEALHERYRDLGKEYPLMKAKHAFACLIEEEGLSPEKLSIDSLFSLLDSSVETYRRIAQRTYESRQKDYTHHFRKITYSSDEEMTAVTGSLEKNEFIAQIQAEAEDYAFRVDTVKSAYRGER